jgi:hypothetical protein
MNKLAAMLVGNPAQMGKNTQPGAPAAAGNMPGPAQMPFPQQEAAFRLPPPPAPFKPPAPVPKNAPLTGAIEAKAPSKSTTEAPKSEGGGMAKQSNLNDMLSKPRVEFPSSSSVPAPPAPKAFKPGKAGKFKSFRSGATSGNI